MNEICRLSSGQMACIENFIESKGRGLMTSDKVYIFQDDSKVEISLLGAEIRRWGSAGRELIWSGDSQFWSGTAPILFPICGSLRDGKTQIDGIERRMETHGFALTSLFSVSEKADDSVSLVLASDDATRAVFPYDFQLTVTVGLTEGGLRQTVDVKNTGSRPMPFSVGIHPAFVFADGRGEVQFSHDEAAEIPLVRNKLVTGESKPSGVKDGRIFIDTRESFDLGALCFFDANSNSLEFRDSAGQGMRVDVGGFPHLILWAARGAPFLSVEAWTGHGDSQDFSGDFDERRSTRFVDPGETHRYFAEFTPR